MEVMKSPSGGKEAGVKKGDGLAAYEEEDEGEEEDSGDDGGDSSGDEGQGPPAPGSATRRGSTGGNEIK